jgi:phage N-6-adenine-methyltransferase
MGLTGRPLTYHPDRPATTAERQRRWKQQHSAEVQGLRAKLKQKVYHESKRADWETPWHVFDPYNDEFAFSLDVCAEAHTRKCARYFSPEQDGLAQDWGEDICWMNPPYGTQIGVWMEKAYRSSLSGATVVCLVPSRTGTLWWHAWVRDKAEIRYRKGRIRFVGAPSGATFDAAAVIYRPHQWPTS